MLSFLLIGIVVGTVLAIPPGPIAIAVTRHGLEGNLSFGLKVALGAALMDAVYALMAAFASSALVVALADAISANGWLPLVFQVACVILLVILGLKYLRQEFVFVDEQSMEKREQAQEERAQRMGYSSPFILGVLISVTNLALPTFIPSIIGVVGYLNAEGWLVPSTEARFNFAAGFGLGTFLWFSIMLQLLVKHRKKFSPDVLAGIYRFAGGAFLLAAVGLTFNVIARTEWAVLFAS